MSAQPAKPEKALRLIAAIALMVAPIALVTNAIWKLGIFRHISSLRDTSFAAYLVAHYSSMIVAVLITFLGYWLASRVYPSKKASERDWIDRVLFVPCYLGAFITIDIVSESVSLGPEGKWWLSISLLAAFMALYGLIHKQRKKKKQAQQFNNEVHQ